MLREQAWLKIINGLDYERRQAIDEGKNLDRVEKKFDEILAMDEANPQKYLLAAELYKEVGNLPLRSDYAYIEPDDLEGIKNERPIQLPIKQEMVEEGQLYNKILGAYLGRCAGCLLGQPIEGWKRERITGLLKDTNNYPINFYISSKIAPELREKYKISDTRDWYDGQTVNWINNVKYMPEDDDINYTIIGLKLVETYGIHFTSDDVAESWLMNLPILHTCTAERVAYRNLTNSVYPPESAKHQNPYREWIGAQIRADFYGYLTPGDPELAAELGFRDAAISHVKNGLYGEMFVAAMISASAVTKNIEKIIKIGLSQIPKNSRLSEKINLIFKWKNESMNWEQVIDRIHSMYDEACEYDWCHVLPNAMLVCTALLYGESEFEKSIGIAVMGGFDTDCNGATVGSVIGMILGEKGLPEKWTKPLGNLVKSGVDGFFNVNISELAERTMKLAVKYMDPEA